MKLLIHLPTIMKYLEIVMAYLPIAMATTAIITLLLIKI